MLKNINLVKAVLSYVLFFVFLFASNETFAAGVVPCGLSSTDPCTLCHLIVGIKNLMDWGMAILITLSVTAIALGGITYVISSGDPELTKKAKGFVTSTVIGFSLMLGAWLIINTTLWLFAAKGDLGLGEGKNWYTFTCSTTSSSTGTTTTTAGAATTATTTMGSVNCDNYTFQTTSIKTQCTNGDMSSSVPAMITCIETALRTKITISSISDNNGGGVNCYRNNPTWKQCTSDAATDCCHHGTSSCHYGGTAATGKSEAIDISTTAGISASTILSAANACKASGSIGYVKDESEKYNHIHVSTTACQNN